MADSFPQLSAAVTLLAALVSALVALAVFALNQFVQHRRDRTRLLTAKLEEVLGNVGVISSSLASLSEQYNARDGKNSPESLCELAEQMQKVRSLLYQSRAIVTLHFPLVLNEWETFVKSVQEVALSLYCEPEVCSCGASEINKLYGRVTSAERLFLVKCTNDVHILLEEYWLQPRARLSFQVIRIPTEQPANRDA